MEINKLLDEMNDPKMKELLTSFLSGWMDRINREKEKENPKKNELFNNHCCHWEEMVKKNYPELAEINQEFLDWVIGYYGEELQDYYLCGVCDGIRAVKWMLKL